VNDGAGCFFVEEWADTIELTNVKVAGVGKCSYLVGESKMFIEDEADIASRVDMLRGQFCISVIRPTICYGWNVLCTVTVALLVTVLSVIAVATLHSVRSVLKVWLYFRSVHDR